MLVVSDSPIDGHAPLVADLARHYASLRPGPVLAYDFAGAPAQTFFTLGCVGLLSAPALDAGPAAHLAELRAETQDVTTIMSWMRVRL